MTTTPGLLGSALTLPRPLADPLSYPGSGAPWAEVLAAALAIAALALLWRWHRRRRRFEAAAPAPPLGRQPRGTADEIRELRDLHLHQRTYRQGCHQLSSLLREHFERVGFSTRERLPCTRLTSPEISHRLGEGGPSRLFLDLARLQWSEAGPGRNAFRTICSRAVQTVSREAEA